jgi:hypothetical protein
MRLMVATNIMLARCEERNATDLPLLVEELEVLLLTLSALSTHTINQDPADRFSRFFVAV